MNAKADSQIPNEILLRDADEDILEVYLEESEELGVEAEGALLELEANPTDAEAINTVFRAFHTIKGTSAILEIDAISKLAHRSESMLSKVRDGSMVYSSEIADLALAAIDQIRKLNAILPDAKDSAVPLDEGYAGLFSAIEAMTEGGAAAAAPAPAAGAEAAPAPAAKKRASRKKTASKAKASEAEASEAAPAEESAPAGKAPTPARAESPAPEGKAEGKAEAKAEAKADAKSKSGDNTIRVRMDRLDHLVNMVGELVISHSLVTQDTGEFSTTRPELSQKLSQLGKIVRSLHDLSMSMRMVQFQSVYRKLVRVVRDTARKQGKEINFVTAGDDTEIDRNMVDLVSDPLIHMVRNAIDHGIEDAEDRKKAGKPVAGQIHLTAEHVGGSIVITLRDDGRGLDRDVILSKAIEKGIVESEKGLSDRDILELIFAPGFSTAKEVTDVSGRGVGMDVVRRNIEALNGRVEIQSEIGQGTTLSIVLPLTLTITDGMLVKVGSQRFIIPTSDIHLSLRPRAEDLKSVTGKGEIYMLRGKALPMFRLHRLFGIPDVVTEASDALLVILIDGDRQWALMVDELLGQQQVVTKSMDELAGSAKGFSGAAIMGDGSVGLILDSTSLLNMFRQASSQELKTNAEELARAAAEMVEAVEEAVEEASSESSFEPSREPSRESESQPEPVLEPVGAA